MAVLNKWDLFKIIYRTLYIQGAWNYERMLGLGFCFCLIPFIKKSFQGSADRINFLKRNLDLFNTHPYMASWIVGATIKLEEQTIFQKKRNKVDIDKFKTRLSELLGAVGDQLFWRQLKPITAMLGLMVTLYLNIVGLFAFLILFNLPHIFVRINGVFAGYRLGFDVLEKISLKKYNQLLDNLDKVGSLLIGALVVLFVNSHYIFKFDELVSFFVGAGLMFYLVKWNVSIPLALMALITLSVVLGGLFVF